MFDKKYSAAQLAKVGGNEWKKDKYHRAYFNATALSDLYGLEVQRDSTTKVTGGRLNGEVISGDAAWKIIVDFSKGKFWYDFADNKFHCQDMDNQRFETVVKALKKRL